MRFRLEFHYTHNSISMSDMFEYLGDAKSIFMLYWNLHHELKYPHVHVYDLRGVECDMARGLQGMIDYWPCLRIL